jgi:ribulose bisphosphate carboxylase small subunit
MRLTQGAFSFLPDLTDEQIVKQVQYAISKGWALNVEFTAIDYLVYSWFQQTTFVWIMSHSR